MNAFVKAMDGLGLLWKIILALPGFDIVWNIYRLMRSVDSKNILGIVLAVLLIVIGWAFLWVVDIISLLLTHRVLWID